jgi:threonine/homoserine/homoserine lactone efflux protein
VHPLRQRGSVTMASVLPLLKPLLTIAVVHLLAAMSPGPSFIAVSRLSLASGRRAGLASALACGLGVLPWAVGALLGLVIVLNRAPWLYMALKAAGGFYLLYLAVMAWKHASLPIAVDGTAPRQALGQAFQQTFLIQITNPKVAIFFSAIFVSVLPPDPPLWMVAAILGIVFINESAWYAVVALGMSASRPRALYLRLKPALEKVMGAVLGAFGVKLLVDAVRAA